MRVCYFGTYREEYSRNQIMIEGLRRSGVEVIECHEPLWHGIEDRVQAASGGWLRPAFLGRVILAYWRLLQRYRRVGQYDIMVVGYPGQFDVFVARLLTWTRRKPLVWDIFMSIYLIALERGLEERNHFTIGFLRWLEGLACRLPDLLILDTSEYVAWFEKTYHLPAGQFRLVPTGADDRIFHCLDTHPSEDGLFHVLYYGTFIPNHGIRYIIEAARLLADDPAIHIEMIGDGPECELAQTLTRQYHLENVAFMQWLQKKELVQRVAQADICLGAFGATPQSLMTVQNKIYEGLAMAKPVVTGDSPAVRQALTHGVHVYLCARQDPPALAQAIQMLKTDPQLRNSLAENGYAVFHEKFDLFHIGQNFARCLLAAIENRK